MPDYANLRSTAYRTAIKTSSPVRPQINRETGTYTIYPEGIDWPARHEIYYPTETAGQPDVFAKGMYIRPQDWMDGRTGETEITDLPQVDYDMGRASIQRQFLEDMKNAEGFKAISPETYVALTQEANTVMASRLARLEQNYNRSELQFKQIRQNPNLSRNEQYEAMAKYYDSNPVYEPKRISAPETLTPQQQMLGEMMAGMEEETPMIPTETLPAEPTEMPAPATSIVGQIPPKPIGYPDAVYNKQLKMWTIIRNGRLVGLKEE